MGLEEYEFDGFQAPIGLSANLMAEVVGVSLIRLAGKITRM